MARGCRIAVASVWFLVGVTFAAVSVAQSVPPGEVESRSANQHWRAVVEPADAVTAARVRVSRHPEDRESWSVPLTNAVSPADVYVTNDGRRVVTVGNLGRPGLGDDAVAIYGPDGPLERYSLAQVLGVAEGAVGAHPDVLPAADGYRWRSGAEILLQDPDEPAGFWIWLPGARKWVGWELAHGKPLDLDPQRTARLNALLRARGIARLASEERWDPWQSARYWPLETLAYQRQPQDRAHLERALASPRFRTGELTVVRDGRERRWHVGEAPMRREADRLLAEWDGQPIARDDTGEAIGARLGAVRGELHLPRTPGGGGVIQVLLLPLDESLRPRAPLPVQRLDIDIATAGPGQRVPFRVGTVTPGDYRVLAIWGKHPANRDFALYEPSPGEWLSVGPTIRVEAGRLTDVGTFGAGRVAPTSR